MSRLALTSKLLIKLQRELLSSPQETCAILFGRAVQKHGQLSRIVVREVQWITEADYGKRSEIEAQLRPEIISTVAQRARKSGESIIFVHSHPFELNQFSPTDDAGEKLLAEFLQRRTPGVVHATMLVTPEVVLARVLGSNQAIEVVGVGPQLLWGKDAGIESKKDTFDRQVRMFGESGQKRLREMRVGIVGLGGTGAVVLEELAHLGVRRFVLMDPDVVEHTNLNRLVGATESDIGKLKVEVAAAHALRISPNADIETRRGSVLLASEAEELSSTDFVFCCTDSQGSRAVLNQFAYQYLVAEAKRAYALVVAHEITEKLERMEDESR